MLGVWPEVELEVEEALTTQLLISFPATLPTPPLL